MELGVLQVQVQREEQLVLPQLVRALVRVQREERLVLEQRWHHHSPWQP